MMEIILERQMSGLDSGEREFFGCELDNQQQVQKDEHRSFDNFRLMTSYLLTNI